MQATKVKMEHSLTRNEAVKYLNRYAGDADWAHHMQRKWELLSSRMRMDDAEELFKKIIACTILLPTFDKSRLTDPPQNLFHGCMKYDQFDERDWVELLHKVKERDIEIRQWRNQCLSLGIIAPIQYSPITRQAYNWLYGKAVDTGVVTPENKASIVDSMEKLVYAYGGQVICGIFTKEEWKINKKVLNWKSNYFFERLIYDVYTFDQVFKIKQQELKKTNSKLVQQIRKV